MTDGHNENKFRFEQSARILDWFVLEGAEVNVDLDSEPEVSAILGDFQFFVGRPTCEDFLWDGHPICDRDHVVELGGLAVLGSPLPEEVLEELVAPLIPPRPLGCEDSDIEVQTDGDETGDSLNVWLYRRFSSTELGSPDLDDQIREFVILTHKIASAVSS